MFRLVLSIFLVVAFAGASAASVMHGLNHGVIDAGHHGEMTEIDPLADAYKALADCCDASGNLGSTSCFGDLVAAAGISPITLPMNSERRLAYAGPDFVALTPAVPTGPPKV